MAAVSPTEPDESQRWG